MLGTKFLESTTKSSAGFRRCFQNQNAMAALGKVMHACTWLCEHFGKCIAAVHAAQLHVSCRDFSSLCPCHRALLSSKASRCPDSHPCWEITICRALLFISNSFSHIALHRGAQCTPMGLCFIEKLLFNEKKKRAEAGWACGVLFCRASSVFKQCLLSGNMRKKCRTAREASGHGADPGNTW